MNNPQARLSEEKLRSLIARACKALYQRGLVAATDGNVSARLSSDRILVTPSGISKGLIEPAALMVCDLKGRKIRGQGAVTLEIHLHLAAYLERSDIGAVVHAHPPMASAFTFARKQELFLEPILPEVVAHIGPIPTAPYATPGTRALAHVLIPYLRRHDVVLLAQHGAVALGQDPWAAYLRMEKLEHAANILKAAWELAGTGKGISRLTVDQVSELMRYYGQGRKFYSYPRGLKDFKKRLNSLR